MLPFKIKFHKLTLNKMFHVLIVLTLLTSVTLAHDDVNWCKPVEAYDSYSMTLELLGVVEMNEMEVELLINKTLLRAGCVYQLLNSSLIDTVNCSQCLTAENIYQTLDLPVGSVITQSDYYNLNIILATYLSDLPRYCLEAQSRNWAATTTSYFLHELLDIGNSYPPSNHTHEDGGHDHHLEIGQVEYLLRQISQSYVPGQDVVISVGDAERADVVQSLCDFQSIRSFNSREVSELTNGTHPEEYIDEDLIGPMCGIVITRLLYGECISRIEQGLAASDDFVKSLFQSYAEAGSCEIADEGLDRMATALSIGALEHDHEHSAQIIVNERDQSVNPTDHRSRRKRATAEEDHDHGHSMDVNTTCVTLNDLMKSFSLDPDHPHLSKTDLLRICPALLQQTTQGCPNSLHVQPAQDPKPSAAEAYGYGTLAVFVVSLCCFFGLIIVRWRHTPAYRYIMSVMLGLGVGSLVGDALLHLIPHGLGLHDHATDDGHDHDTASGFVVEPFIWKMLCACGSIWFYYILQLTLYQMGKYIEKSKVGDQVSVVIHDNVAFNGSVHNETVSASNFSHDHNNCELKSTKSLEDNTETSKDRAPSYSNISMSRKSDRGDTVSDVHHSHSSVAWMVTFGDGIHNFADGLAMGAAFSKSWKIGLSTTIAIFAHELPHEFGDTAIMLSSGWSVGKVALCQMGSQATAFIGLYIGIAVSDNSADAQEWIFSITCGLFLYVALANIIPELVEYFCCYKPLWVFICSNVGILIGFGTMLTLAIFEEEIVIT